MRFPRFLFFLVAAVGVCLTPHVATAVELELTKEWQVVGENDTVPAGAHIQMDMTTGEKRAKLVDDGDNGDATQNVAISSDGSVAVVPRETKGGKKEGGEEEKRTYDYDMMYRSLSNLPEEEVERMGGLPQPPKEEDDDKKEKSREYWEEQMKKIWERRQQELKDLQDGIIDLPEVLKDRIARIKAYLEDPYGHLKELQEKSGQEPAEEDEDLVTDIVSVLEDLELQLGDVDMTRDFHTLGGWPLLTSLLSNDVHVTNETESLASYVSVVQLNAAWAMGTAVKNTGEFFPYATESVTVNGKATTPIELLLGQLQGKSEDSSSSAESKKLQKVLYGLGALLRGNRIGQVAFLEMNGPSALSSFLKDALGSEVALAKRALTLAGDIAADVLLHDEKGEFKVIVDAFSTPEFCQSCLDGLEYKKLRESSMRTIQTLAPHCDWDKKAATAAVQAVKQSWQADDPDMDHQVRRELLDLAGDVVSRIKGA